MFSKKFWSAHVFDKFQILAGLYLAFFLLYHVGVVLVARTLWEIDTNFYFAAAGVGKYPSNLFFIPYYSLSVVSVFVHVACVHRAKTMEKQGDKKATRIAYSIIGAGGMIAATIIFTMI